MLQGIVKALLDANLLPRVVSGSSAGSIGEQQGTRSIRMFQAEQEAHHGEVQ